MQQECFQLETIWKDNKMRIVVNNKEVTAYSSKFAYHAPECENLLDSFNKNTQSRNGI